MEINNKDLNYYISTKTKIITLSLGVIFLICGVLMLIFKPDAPFYLDPFMESPFPYWGGLFLLTLICILIFIQQLGEQRNSIYYLSKDGKFDLTTPRSYVKLRRPKLVELFNYFKIKEFTYDGNGNVKIVSDKGKKIESPLSELKVKYWMAKNKVTGEWYIQRMKIVDSYGNKLMFYTNGVLMPSEFDDIHMILSTSGEVKESKMSKADKWAYKFKEVIEDFDFSDLTGSIINKVVNEGMPTVTTPIINNVKARLYKNAEKKKGLKKFLDILKKFFNNFILVLFGLYILMIIIVNVANLPEIFGEDDLKWEREQILNEGFVGEDELSDQQEEILTQQLKFSGHISNRKVELNLIFYSQFLIDNVGNRYNVTGKIVYPYDAEILGVYQNGLLELNELEERDENYNLDAIFKGKLEEHNNTIVYEGNYYWYTSSEYEPFIFQSEIISKNNSASSDEFRKYILNGKIDAKYPIEMVVLFQNNDVIEATYRYTKTGSGEWIPLVLSKNDLGQTIMTEIINGEKNGEFEGRVVFEKNKIKYFGWFTNFKSQKNYIFSIENEN